VPTHTCFGTKMSSSVSLTAKKDRKVKRGRNNIKFADDQQAKAIYNYRAIKKVSVHLMITIQKDESNVQRVHRQSPDIY